MEPYEEVVLEVDPVEEQGDGVITRMKSTRKNILKHITESISNIEDFKRQSLQSNIILESDISESFQKINATLKEIYKNIKNLPVISQDIVVIKHFQDFQDMEKPIKTKINSKYIFLCENIYVYFLISFSMDRLMVEGYATYMETSLNDYQPKGIDVAIYLLDQPMTENKKEFKKTFMLENMEKKEINFMNEKVFTKVDFNGNFLVSDKAFLEISVNATDVIMSTL